MTQVAAIRASTPQDRAWIQNTLQRNRGGTTIVVHDQAFECLRMPARIAGERDGLLIYRGGELAEIILLESFQADFACGRLDRGRWIVPDS